MTKKVRETEAEATAFVVFQSIGLESGTTAEDYIRLWHGDAALLQESLEVVQRTAAIILGAISPRPELPTQAEPLQTETQSEPQSEPQTEAQSEGQNPATFTPASTSATDLVDSVPF